MISNFDTKKYQLLDALIERKGIQNLMDVAEAVFDNPVFVGDISMNILCHSQGDPNDPFWNQVCTLGYANESIIKDCNKNGGFGELYQTDQPQIKIFPFTDSPFLSARIRDGIHVMGHVCIYGCNRPFTAEDQKLIVLFCKVLAYEMIYRGLSSGGNISYFSLMVDLISNTTLSEKDILTRAANAHCRIPLPMRVVLIHGKDEHKSTLHFLREHFAAELNDSMVIAYKEDIIAFCAADQEQWAHNHTVLTHALSGSSYYCGISRIVETVSDIQKAVHQASNTLRTTPKMQPATLYFYDNCVHYHLFSMIRDKEQLLQLVDPRLTKLKQHDQKKHTELFSTLRTYLLCNRNINLAADKLCIHKNSMYYRKDSIEQVLGEKITDEQLCFSLDLSYRILEYCEEL